VIALNDLPRADRVVVVVSNHYLRYAVLKWSAKLRTKEEWLAYATHHFTEIHGNVAAAWAIRASEPKIGKPAIACAVDVALLERLREVPGIRSIQPYLIAALNSRRRAVSGDAWFVLQEPGRLTMSLMGRRGWKLVRNRYVSQDWRMQLPHLLDRETLALDVPPVERVVLCAEDEPTDAPANMEGYRITDLTLLRGASGDSRNTIMAQC